MINKFINNIQTKLTKKREENKNYKATLPNSSKFTNLKPLPQLLHIKKEGLITKILNDCPDLNKDKAIIISNLIPINETYLTTLYTTEIISNTEYWLIPTNKYIWIINNKSYDILSYQDITICTIIKNNLMGKIINLNNIILEITGNTEKINHFINLLTNTNYRNQTIATKTSYLCGITPIFQTINSIQTGISIDNQKNIVFHTKKFNYVYHYNDIINYELLLDNTIVSSKKLKSTSTITSIQNSCYTMSIRITTTNQSFILPILEESAMNKKYTYQDQTYISNLNFAKDIINTLDKLTPNNY